MIKVVKESLYEDWWDTISKGIHDEESQFKGFKEEGPEEEKKLRKKSKKNTMIGKRKNFKKYKGIHRNVASVDEPKVTKPDNNVK